MGRNWLRAYKITCGAAGSTGFSTDKLHIAFEIQKTEDESSNTAKISLWNLNDEHVEMVCEKDCYVELSAGYENNPLPTIFKGYVTFGDTELDGADRKTTFECADGWVEKRDSYSSRSYTGKTRNKNVIEDAAADMGLSVKFADDCEFTDFPNGYSFIGQTSASLTKACNASGLSWYIDNGIIHIKKSKGTMSRQCFLLNSSTGLIGVPKRLTETGDSSDDKKTVGYEVQYFLNAGINVSDYVKLETQKVSGYFRVESLTISGDNFSGDWVCKATLKIDSE